MSELDLETRADVLRTVTLKAGRQALDAFNHRTAGVFALKGQQDPVTETDGAVERQLRQEIGQMFPDDGFFGEETGAGEAAFGKGGLWVVDPIDGTDNFARGIPHFCVSIAFVADNKVLLGAIYSPVSGEFYFARAGHGAFKNGQTLAISQTPKMAQAAVELGWSHRISGKHYFAVLAGLIDRGANVRRSGSGALALAWVAEGRLDGYAELHMNSWDSLAGVLLVREAGGVTSEPASQAQSLSEGGLVFAANRAISGALVATLPIESAA